jgi:sulfatase modifying factor 1
MTRCKIAIMLPFAAFMIAACGKTAHGTPISIDWATVGDPGNAPDPLTGGIYGGVGYEFRISTTEVTNAHYAAYLNTIDPTGVNPHGVYKGPMGSSSTGGINLVSSAPTGAKYVIKQNMGNKPVIGVNFITAMRFVNWLENGQGSDGTESGVYTISNGLTEIRATGAQYFLPSESEWYKAAYYDPTPGAGGGDNYWLYPTRSDSPPIMATATIIGDVANPGPNVANFGNGAVWPATSSNLTTAGSAGPQSASYYGTFDQGGNMNEWTEAISNSAARVFRGGTYNLPEDRMRSTLRSALPPNLDSILFGFRVAGSIPEPSTVALMTIAMVVLRRGNKRRQETI